MADVRCKPKLMVGTGCTKLKAKSSLHWKILPSEVVSDNKPWIIVAHSTDEQQQMYNWWYPNILESSSRQILGTATFFFYGFNLYRNEKEGTNVLCFVIDKNMMNETAFGNDTVPQFYEFSAPEHNSFYVKYFNYEENCKSLKVPEEKLTAHDIHFEKSMVNFMLAMKIFLNIGKFSI